MFIVTLTYICELEEVDRLLPKHIKYLNKQYEKGNFIASGRKVPRTGGVILSKVQSLDILEKILEEDPFKIEKLADYNIVEFLPSITSKEFENLKEC